MTSSGHRGGRRRVAGSDAGQKSERHPARGYDSHQNFPALRCIQTTFFPALSRSSMSQTVEKKVKKRKHAATDIEQDAEPLTKRHKKEKDKSKKDKGKGRATEEFRVARASMLLSIPPVFAGNLRVGAEEMLDSLLMRCAVLLFHEGNSK